MFPWLYYFVGWLIYQPMLPTLVLLRKNRFYINKNRFLTILVLILYQYHLLANQNQACNCLQVLQPKCNQKRTRTWSPSILRHKFRYDSISTLSKWFCKPCNQQSNFLVLHQATNYHIIIYKGRIHRTCHSCSKCALIKQFTLGTKISWK